MATWIMEDYPGPGEYTPNIDFVKVVFPKYSIPQSTYRYNPNVDPAPGPGYYNLPPYISYPAYTIPCKRQQVIKRQSPRLKPDPRGHRKDYGPFGWQPRSPEQMGKKKKIGQGIITMHHKIKPVETAPIPT